MGIFGGSRKQDGGSDPAFQEQLRVLTERMLGAARDEAEQTGLWSPTFRASWFSEGTTTRRLGLSKEVLGTLQRDLQMEREWTAFDESDDGLRLRWWGGPAPLEIQVSYERDTAFGAAVALDARLDPFEVADPQVGAFAAMRLNQERATSYGWVYDPRTSRLFARTGGIMLQPPAIAVGGSLSPKRLRQAVHELYAIGLVTVGVILTEFMEGNPQWAGLSADVHPLRQEMRADMPDFLLQLGAQLHRMGEETSMAWGSRPARPLFERFRSGLPGEEQERFVQGEQFLNSMGRDASREHSSIVRVPYPSYEPATALFVGNESQPYLGPGLILVHETAYRVAEDSVPLLISALVASESMGGSGASSLGWWYSAPAGSYSGFPAQPGEQLLGFATFLPQGRSRDVDPAEVVGEHVRRGWWLRSILGAPQAPPAPAISFAAS